MDDFHVIPYPPLDVRSEVDDTPGYARCCSPLPPGKVALKSVSLIDIPDDGGWTPPLERTEIEETYSADWSLPPFPPFPFPADGSSTATLNGMSVTASGSVPSDTPTLQTQVKLFQKKRIVQP